MKGWREHKGIQGEPRAGGGCLGKEGGAQGLAGVF